jgi:hypothetical protein
MAAPSSPPTEAKQNAAAIRQKLDLAGGEEIAPGDALTLVGLVETAQDLMNREQTLGQIFRTEELRRQFLHGLGNLQLSERVINQLTSATRGRPDFLEHSLRVAICAAALAQRMNLSRLDITEATAAGVLHDIGMLLVDPTLLEGGRRLEERERHFLNSHPLTGYKLLETEPTLHPVISTAILEHHERLDGSGYPRGLTALRLQPLGQILAVAELAASILAVGGSATAWLRLGVVLRLNEQKLNHQVLSSLLALFPQTPVPMVGRNDLGTSIDVLVRLSVALQHWKAVQPGSADQPMTIFIEQRIDRLSRSLADAGVDLIYWQGLDSDIEHDARSVNEIKLAAREGLWQLIAIAEEARRRWDRLQPVAADVAEWVAAVEALPR